MGNFGSKEDILVEIAVLFKQMDNGKLTIDELDELVNLTSKLHERSLIIRYKAFEEKVFGVKSNIEEVPTTENEILEEELEEKIAPIVEEPTQIIETKIEETKEEPIFGFSLFGDQEDEEEEIVEYPAPKEIIQESSIETFTEIEKEFDIDSENELLVSESEEINTIQDENEPINHQEEIPAERPMSEIERAHAENLARFFNKSQEQQSQTIAESPKEEKPLSTQSIDDEEPQPEYSNLEIEEDLSEVESAFYNEEIGASEVEYLEEEEKNQIEEPIQEIDDINEESVLEIETESSLDQNAMISFIHKYNQVGSNLSSQFGISKIESLIGSFGLNERLQFINELFDGSSENFSNAIKGLDTQTTSDQARSKVAEIAISNNWDVESETVEEFMQKIVRRYA